jgi:hypothetical protein
MTQYFPSSLGTNERQLNVSVWYGVGVGLPSLFAVVFGIPILWLGDYLFGAVLIAMPFVSLVQLKRLERHRPIQLTAIAEIRSVKRLDSPPVVSHAVDRDSSQGFHGSWGTFRSKEHGDFTGCLTNASNMVELQRNDGYFIFLTPDEPEEFIAALVEGGRRLGVEIENDTEGLVKENTNGGQVISELSA